MCVDITGYRAGSWRRRRRSTFIGTRGRLHYGTIARYMYGNYHIPNYHIITVCPRNQILYNISRHKMMNSSHILHEEGEDQYQHGKPYEGMCCACTMEDITEEDGNYGEI